MKKARFVWLCVVASVVVSLSSCSMWMRGSDDIHFEFFWWDDDNAYYIIDTNVAGKTIEDNWEMIDVVVPTEHEGKPVTVIGWDSFRQCQILRSVTIPEGITGIHSHTFFDCNNLESVHLPKSMRAFHGSCFASCNSLKEVTVDPDNPWFCSVDGVVYTKDRKELVFYPPGKDDEEFVIPEGCSVIDRYAFAYCENLKRIVITSTVTDISYESILFCKGLEGVLVDEGNAIYSSIGGNLYSKDGEIFFRLCVSTENYVLTLPEGVVEIENGAAYYSQNLTAINLPKSLLSIGDSAFLNCDQLTVVTIPEKVTYIGDNAFSGCEQLSAAVFEQASGWRVEPQGGKFVSTKTLDRTKLTDSETAAEYLSKTYRGWKWRRED